LSQLAIDRLVCPIGVEGVEGKAPAIIAISVAAQLLQVLKDPAEVARSREIPLVARAVGERVVTPGPRYARGRSFGDCAAENCDSCGTHGRASL